MPRREELSSILVLGSGPIVIGQGCEFDYSGTSACRALRAEGIRVVLLNSNPATIMTDPELADATYLEPLTLEVARKVIEAERPVALLPTLGGQTALNLAVALAQAGVLERYGVELIGASLSSIQEAEDRARFDQAMRSIGVAVAPSQVVGSVEQARSLLPTLPLPWILRPSYTLGGAGGGVVEEAGGLEEAIETALRESPTHTVLVEKSIAGWKEYELEMMRDSRDNAVVVCSIENLDPMGVHTGDSITVAPAQTLTDKELQAMRDEALAILRRIGVDTGGCNIQFAVNPMTGERVVIEMNPRVSRSSALASKATGYPIAKIAALLAIGYSLDELVNDIAGSTPACFEPALDYVVTKIPRFTFEKFPGADDRLTTSMRSVGEVMALGRTFLESLGKALASLEQGTGSLEAPQAWAQTSDAALLEQLKTPRPERLLLVAEALRRGLEPMALSQQTGIDVFYVRHLKTLIELERAVQADGLCEADPTNLPSSANSAAEPEGRPRLEPRSTGTAERVRFWKRLKQHGLSDARLASITGYEEAAVRHAREALGVVSVFKRVDTCAAEFEAETPYLYSCYEDEDESAPSARRKVIILGSGPNRIGQGLEFDYCCVQAAFALREAGIEAIMVNCNPETVSTDYDTSDRLYFEPLTLEHVLQVVRTESSRGELLGCIVQFGGQTPLNLAGSLEALGIPILGTQPAAIDRAEDREQFLSLLEQQGLVAPKGGMAATAHEALALAEALGYPVMVRPSFVLGGRAMEILHDASELDHYVNHTMQLSREQPVLIDRFLRDAVEVDVDILFDGHEGLVAGVLEHIEEAGIHSGDSACSLPPFSLGPETVRDLGRAATLLAKELEVVGLLNVQFALLGRRIYVIEANPRASRTVPFVGKATGIPIAKLATHLMLGTRLRALGYGGLAGGMLPAPPYFAVKEAVFPFGKLPGTDPQLGPEMHSTGEVMGIAQEFSEAYGKAQCAAGNALPQSGQAFLSVRDEDKEELVEIARRLAAAGFGLVATRGTAAFLGQRQIPCATLRKVREGSPHCVDAIRAGEVTLVVNTSSGRKEILDSASIRRQTVLRGVPYVTTLAAAKAALGAIEGAGEWCVRPLQRYHAQMAQSAAWAARLTEPQSPE